MELGRSAANLLTIIKSDLCVFQPFCVTGSICIFASFPVEHVGIRFISRGTLTIINLDILHIRLIACYLGEAKTECLVRKFNEMELNQKRNAWDGQGRKFK